MLKGEVGRKLPTDCKQWEFFSDDEEWIKDRRIQFEALEELSDNERATPTTKKATQRRSKKAKLERPPAAQADKAKPSYLTKSENQKPRIALSSVDDLRDSTTFVTKAITVSSCSFDSNLPRFVAWCGVLACFLVWY